LAVKGTPRNGQWLLLGFREYEEVLRKNTFAEEDQYQVELEGVNIYDQLMTGAISSMEGT